MFKMFEDVNEKVRANEFDTDTLIAEYENEDILVLLETKSDGSKNDAYFSYTVLKKEVGTYGYINLDDIELIGIRAFYGCTALESINLQNTYAIGIEAFKGCTSLEQCSQIKKLSFFENNFIISPSKLYHILVQL